MWTLPRPGREAGESARARGRGWACSPGAEFPAAGAAAPGAPPRLGLPALPDAPPQSGVSLPAPRPRCPTALGTSPTCRENRAGLRDAPQESPLCVDRATRVLAAAGPHVRSRQTPGVGELGALAPERSLTRDGFLF